MSDRPSLENLAAIAQRLADEVSFAGEMPVDPRIRSILGQVWPGCFESAHGGVRMQEEAVTRLEALFEMFGVPMLVADNPMAVLLHAYDVFGLNLSEYVTSRLRLGAERFAQYVHDWPTDWRDYIEAVATEDRAAARRWATTLQPLAPDCVYPPDIFLQPAGSKS